MFKKNSIRDVSATLMMFLATVPVFWTLFLFAFSLYLRSFKSVTGGCCCVVDVVRSVVDVLCGSVVNVSVL